MRKSLTQFFAGVAVAKALVGASPVGKAANVLIITKDMAPTFVKGSINAFWQRLTSRWHKVEPKKEIARPNETVVAKPKGE